MMIPNVMLFHEVHRKRALVARVDFISAPGVSAANVHRPGGPTALVTNMGHFTFDRTKARFALESIHPGYSEALIAENTGFAFDRARDLRETPLPDALTLDVIASKVVVDIASIYPQFAQALAASVATLRK
jgi:glutaconate CoA-transferase subunit B